MRHIGESAQWSGSIGSHARSAVHLVRARVRVRVRVRVSVSVSVRVRVRVRV